ncbi:MAG: response regulator, partial [Gemmatimonadales bacterium]
GQIEVEARPGSGSSFTLYFPVAAAPQPSDAPSALPTPTPGAMSDRVILVVEDDDAVRGLVCRTLGRYGYRVLEACNGQDALELAERYSDAIDLLLSDVIMPGLNGRQVADRLARSRAETRVLFMSGHTDGVLGQNSVIEDDRTQLLRKPFTPTELARRVEEALI